MELLHAACVALEDRGLLILGASGAGKSTLALELVALGAQIIADDSVRVTTREGALYAAAPPTLPDLVEARGVGLLRMARRAEARLTLAIDLDRAETERLPALRKMRLIGVALPLILRPTPLSPGVLACALRAWPPADPDDPMDAPA